MARPFWQPSKDDLKKIGLMSIAGITHDQIASVMEVTKKTLYKNKEVRKILDDSLTQANSRVAGVLYNAALKGNMTAVIFWLKTRARWKDSGDDINIKTDKDNKIEFIISKKPDDNQS